MKLLTLLGSVALLTNSVAFAQDKAFQECLAGLESAAVKSGVSRHTFKTLTADFVPDTSLLEKLDYQPEFRTPIWDYLATLVDDERIEEGRDMLDKYSDVLERVQQQYGVDPGTVVAVWGVESNFGKIQGKYSLVNALGTLSCMGRRQEFFRKEFFAALRIIQSGDIPADQLMGSWAGAFGHTQFMPTTFERLAVDFDRDGRRDLMNSAEDALGSAANYLKRNGWNNNETWGFEVKLPPNFPTKDEGRRNKKTIQHWVSKGLVPLAKDARSLTDLANPDQKAGLLLPAGDKGPAFLVFKNFDVIFSYNAANSYALAIAHLSDRLGGGQPFVTPWPTDDLGLSRKERRELQEFLLDLGYDIGEADGVIGSKTREAVKAEQKRRGMKEDGRPGQKLLQSLRND